MDKVLQCTVRQVDSRAATRGRRLSRIKQSRDSFNAGIVKRVVRFSNTSFEKRTTLVSLGIARLHIRWQRNDVDSPDPRSTPFHGHDRVMRFCTFLNPRTTRFPIESGVSVFAGVFATSMLIRCW